jgi:hypothetical protein
MKNLSAKLNSGVSTAAIIGGGVLGLEIADSLLSRKIKTTVIEAASGLFNGKLTEEESDALLNRLNKLENLQILCGKCAKEVAKDGVILQNGEFVDAVGGGVCQVSSTLYNACLLSGLEIIEKNPHSLMVSYVEPGFDAMVNMNSSDFKFKNNTNYPIIIATSNIGDECKICIYGEKNTKTIKKESSVIYDKSVESDGNSYTKVNPRLVVYGDNGQKQVVNLREVKYKTR